MLCHTQNPPKRKRSACFKIRLNSAEHKTIIPRISQLKHVAKILGTQDPDRRAWHGIRAGRLLDREHLRAGEPAARAPGQDGDLDDHHRRALARRPDESDSRCDRGQRRHEEVYSQRVWLC